MTKRTYPYPVLAAVALIVPLLALSTPAQAGFPGSNGTLAFSMTVTSGTTDIFGINTDGSGKTPLANAAAISENQPAWSADGTRIAFTRGDGSTTHVWTMNADGTGQTQLVAPPAGFRDFDPAWSPDGTQIVFSRRKVDQTVPDMLTIVGANGQGLQELAAGAQASWGPTGLIAFAGECGFAQGICVIQPDGNGLAPVIETTGESGDPNWSPDGAKLAYWEGLSTYTVNLNGSAKTLIGTGIVPAWSPDGTLIAALCASAAPACSIPLSIVLLNADGSGTPTVVPNTAPARYVDWQPIGGGGGGPGGVDAIVEVVEELPASSLRSGGIRTAMLSILADTEAAITAGDSGAALDLLRNLRRHTDGCGAAPDRNDWVRTCSAQQTLVPPIDDLVASLGG